MKKLSILTLVITIIGLASCTAQSPKASFKSDVDSLSYSIGVSQTQGLVGYLGSMGVDSAYMDHFIKGLNEGITKKGKKHQAYVVGLQIAQQINQQMFPGMNQQIFKGSETDSINRDNFLAGFIAGTTGKGMLMTMEEAQALTEKKIEAIQEKGLLEEYGDVKEAGELFLAENKVKEGVNTTESGLQYKIIKEGKGEIPTSTDKVKVNYKGTLIDGTEFDSSYGRESPSEFQANRVISGWTEALTMMPVGSKWELYIPYNLAYGKNAQGQHIKPFSALMFEIELLGIEKSKDK